MAASNTAGCGFSPPLQVWSLATAAAAGDVAAAEAALGGRRGAAVDATLTAAGRTALHIAAANGHVPMVAALLDWGAAIDATDDNGCTPLKYAVHLGFQEYDDGMPDSQVVRERCMEAIAASEPGVG